MIRMRRWAAVIALAALAAPAAAQDAGVSLDLGAGGTETGYVKLVLLFASVSLAPALLAVVTSFARIVVVLMFLRAGLGAQDIPPTQVIIGLALLLAVVTMLPTLQTIYDDALGPLLAEEMAPGDAAEAAVGPLREFMGRQVRGADLELMLSLTDRAPETPSAEAPTSVLSAAFAISELRAAFLIGFVIYLPFVIIDLVVGSTLASVGMLSIPAPLLSLPFKVLLFVLVDGWALLTEALVSTFS